MNLVITPAFRPVVLVSFMAGDAMNIDCLYGWIPPRQIEGYEIGVRRESLLHLVAQFVVYPLELYDAVEHVGEPAASHHPVYPWWFNDFLFLFS
jgi:hypothetical protein